MLRRAGTRPIPCQGGCSQRDRLVPPPCSPLARGCAASSLIMGNCGERSQPAFGRRLVPECPEGPPSPPDGGRGASSLPTGAACSWVLVARANPSMEPCAGASPGVSGGSLRSPSRSPCLGLPSQGCSCSARGSHLIYFQQPSPAFPCLLPVPALPQPLPQESSFGESGRVPVAGAAESGMTDLCPVAAKLLSPPSTSPETWGQFVGFALLR